MGGIYLQYRYELLDNTPALVVKLILPQLERLVCCNTVDWLSILEGKHHHIMGRVPTCDDISRDQLWF